MSSDKVTCPVSPLDLSDVIIRSYRTGAVLNGRVGLQDDGVAQFTLDTTARLSDTGKVYCSLANVTGNTTVDSPLTHIYVFSQYSFKFTHGCRLCLGGSQLVLKG